MISNPSKLSSNHLTLVLDTSVVINLLATKEPAAVIGALKRRVVIDDVALGEVDLTRAGRRDLLPSIQELQALGVVAVWHMDDQAFERFVDLTGATPPDDLDDGEAAVLAQSMCNNGCVAVIDERKATRIASSYCPSVPILTSMDLFSAPEVIGELGVSRLAEFVYRALVDARMRVPSAYRPWVTGLLGPEKIANCPSLGPAPTSRDKRVISPPGLADKAFRARRRSRKQPTS